ncbi:FimB/Mfa2 family fimbrial subunit [Phocaeicola sp.]
MKRILYSIQTRIYELLAIVACGTMLASCDNILDNGYGDCTMKYRVKFKYDYNMKKADAFANEVKSVTLYAFDDDGKFVYQRTEQGDVLAAEDYSMPVEVEPGDYHLVSWAGLEGENSFAVPVLTEGESTIDELKCRMNRIYGRAADGSAIVSDHLASLFHGEVTKQSFSRAAGREQVITVPLVKNTNNIRIILQQISDKKVDVSKFEFTITDDNGLMNYNNNLLDDETLTYYPWYTAQGTTNRSATGRAEGESEETGISVAVAQLTVGRLVEENHPQLTITNKESGQVVLSIPLIDYLVMTEAEGHNMDNQEYLDRQDEYNMTFFLGPDMSWIKTQIIINGWTVRFNDFGGLE